MRAEDLTRMANQIADFFEPYPADEAAGMVAEHIRAFWPPNMRRDLARLFAEDALPALKPLALAGVRLVVDAGKSAA